MRATEWLSRYHEAQASLDALMRDPPFLYKGKPGSPVNVDWEDGALNIHATIKDPEAALHLARLLIEAFGEDIAPTDRRS